jgi:hypothetical protein
LLLKGQVKGKTTQSVVALFSFRTPPLRDHDPPQAESNPLPRQNRTFRLRRIAFFHFTLPATGLALPFASLQVDIKKIGKLYDKSFFDIINNVFKPIMVIQLCQRKKM